MSFLSKNEIEISQEFLDQGYIIRPTADLKATDWIREQFVYLVAKKIQVDKNQPTSKMLDLIHTRIDKEHLNEFRLSIIEQINKIQGFRENYFKIAKPYIEAIIGNELAMQLRVNLSIQLPNDSSSLLSVHADTWNGDSPYEAVLWVPLVDCYKTKAMYILPRSKLPKLEKHLANGKFHDSTTIFQAIKDDVNWLDVKYGEFVLFDQGLPHGNVENVEFETRWSMNCRFKGLFTPYEDKKLGEFFEPITLKPMSKIGMRYKLPDLS